MRLRKALRKIHRWIGLLSSLWLLQLAFTGLLLQHAKSLKLTSNYVHSPTILQWFDYGRNIQVFESEHRAIYQVDDVLAINGQSHQVAEKIVSALMWQDQWLIATENSLSVYLENGELMNQWDDFDGLPTPVEVIGHNQNALYIKSQSSWYELKQPDEFRPVSGVNIEPAPASRRQLNSTEKELLFADVLSDKLSYDKVIHGIHSGLKSSIWLNSISALALLYLCFSGIYLFFKAPKNRRNK